MSFGHGNSIARLQHGIRRLAVLYLAQVVFGCREPAVSTLSRYFDFAARGPSNTSARKYCLHQRQTVMKRFLTRRVERSPGVKECKGFCGRSAHFDQVARQNERRGRVVIFEINVDDGRATAQDSGGYSFKPGLGFGEDDVKRSRLAPEK